MQIKKQKKSKILEKLISLVNTCKYTINELKLKDSNTSYFGLNMEEDSGLEGSQTLQNLAAGRLAESASRMRCTSWRWRVGSILMSVLVVAQNVIT